MERENTDNTFENKLFGDIAYIGDTLRDPMLNDAIKCAKDVDAELQKSSRTVEERIKDATEVAQMLDGESWQTLMNQSVTVTGHMQRIIVNKHAESPYVYRKDPLYGDSFFVEDGKFYSGGFCVVCDDMDVSIRALVAQTQPDEQGQIRAEFYAASLDSLLLFDTVMSSQHASALLDTYTPSTLQELERCTFDAPDRGRALTALKGLDMSEIDALSEDKATQRRVMAALCSRAMAAISLDTGMPYYIDYEGDAYVSTDQGLQTIGIDCKDAAVSLDAICTIMDNTKQTETELGLMATIHAEEQDFDVTLHVDNIDAARSMRDSL